MTARRNNMEAFRLAKAVKGLARAEKLALICIADACSMWDGVCKKSTNTCQDEYGIAVRSFRYGVRGRTRKDGTENYPGLLGRGIVTIASGGTRESGIPTVYKINLDVLRAFAKGKTSAQTTAQTSAQRDEEAARNLTVTLPRSATEDASNLCTNSGEPLHNAAKTSALRQPSSISSSLNSKTQHDTTNLAENHGSVLQIAHVFPSETVATKNCDTTTGAIRKAAVNDSPSPKKDRAEVLLTAARGLANDHGPIGIGLAAAIAATCLNNPNGKGQLPQRTSYYSRTVADKYMLEQDIPFDGYLDGFYYDTIAEEGIDRLRRAAERRGLKLNRVIAQLESMKSELARRGTAA
jgi:hypothetical protein